VGEVKDISIKKVVKTLFILILVVVIAMFIFIFTKIKNLDKEALSLVYPEITMQDVSDGTYEGEAETSMVKATVEVLVKGNKIEDIKIARHENGKGSSAEVIVLDMIAQNNYQVDGISGATLSSSVIKSAVGVALEKGMTQ